MNPGSTFERVYAGLRQQLEGERYRPGDHLEPALLSQELNASITPVRDALHRLTGERLVEAARADGFRVPHLTEMGLRHLYAWNEYVLRLGLGGGRRDRPASVRLTAPAGEPLSPGGAAAATADLFLVIAQMSGNPEQIAAVSNLNQRLSRVRIVEAKLIADTADELRALGDWLGGSDRQALRRGLAAYHRRRRRIAHEIIAALHEPAPAGPAA